MANFLEVRCRSKIRNSKPVLVLNSDFLLLTSYVQLLTSAILLCSTHQLIHSKRYPLHNTLVPSVVLRLCLLGLVRIDKANYTSPSHLVFVNHNL
jgi:hypothetical protein